MSTFLNIHVSAAYNTVLQIRVFAVLFFNSNFIFLLNNSPRLLSAFFSDGYSTFHFLMTSASANTSTLILILILMENWKSSALEVPASVAEWASQAEFWAYYKIIFLSFLLTY